MAATVRRAYGFLGGEGGFGLIELTIALTILAIGITAMTGLFVSGHLALRRASQSDSAAVLADKLLERFRAETWDNIALDDTMVTAAESDSVYANDEALSGPLPNDITNANAPLGADGAAAATACTNSPTPVACIPSRTIPYSNGGFSETAPDGRSYRLDTYVTWACPSNPSDPETLGGSMSAPTCTLSDGTVVPYAPVKVVTVVVRDATSAATLADAPVYRVSSTFDRLGGGSMPTVTVSPTGTGSTGGSTPPPVTGAPNPPSQVSFVNGGGSGSPCPCIATGNEQSLSFDVQLPSTSVASDTVTLTVSDGNPADSVQKTASATQGAGIVHFTQVNGNAINGVGLADGTITFSATTTNTSGTSTATVATTTKDTTAPTGLAISSPASGATGVSRTGPFSGTAGHATGDRSSLTLEFCKGSAWKSSCDSAPDNTMTASVDSSGNWSVSISPQLTNNQAYAVKAVQQDAAGNTGQSGVITFST